MLNIFHRQRIVGLYLICLYSRLSLSLLSIDNLVLFVLTSLSYFYFKVGLIFITVVVGVIVVSIITLISILFYKIYEKDKNESTIGIQNTANQIIISFQNNIN